MNREYGFTKFQIQDENGEFHDLGIVNSLPKVAYKENEEVAQTSFPFKGTISLKVRFPKNDHYRKKKGKRYIVIPYFNYKKYINDFFRRIYE